MSINKRHVPAVVREVARTIRSMFEADKDSSCALDMNLGEILGWQIEKGKDGVVFVNLRLERLAAVAVVTVTKDGEVNHYEVQFPNSRIEMISRADKLDRHFWKLVAKSTRKAAP
jgi:preprotein translocase subunit SecA